MSATIFTNFKSTRLTGVTIDDINTAGGVATVPVGYTPYAESSNGDGWALQLDDETWVVGHVTGKADAVYTSPTLDPDNPDVDPGPPAMTSSAQLSVQLL